MIHENKIWTIDNFLSKSECDELIILSENLGYVEAEVSLDSGSKMLKGVRNNYRLLYQDFNLAKLYWEKLKHYCPNEIENQMVVGLNEQFRFYKYELNQRFKKHRDGSFKRNEFEASKITFMIYLNDEFEGGETAFDDQIIKPLTGKALCFFHELKHEGCPVTNGVKYVLRSDIMFKVS